MSEKIYAWLLRLYPLNFREAYGEEALQLFRDRARHEKGFFQRLRLWLNLLSDLAISVPRQHSRVQPDLVSASARQQVDGAPSFQILNSDLPRPGALIVGSVLSLVALVTFPILLNHHPLSTSIGQRQRTAYARSSASSHPTPQLTEYDAAPRNPFATPSRVSAGGAEPADSQSNSLLILDDSTHSQPQAQQPKPPDVASAIYSAVADEPKLDAAKRHAVIKGALTNLNQYYVYPDVAQKMADALLAHEKSGDDNAATTGSAFADLLTSQMRDVSHDRHLTLAYSRVPVAEHPLGPTPEELAQYRRDMERNNCTFEKVEILSRNIGYLKFNEFPSPSVCRSTVETAMKRLRHVDAIIFDLRDNHGGDPRMVALIATYLFDHPTHLNDMYNRLDKTTQQYWTSLPIPGNKLVDKAAYVLTSASTFSGAEEFSYCTKGNIELSGTGPACPVGKPFENQLVVTSADYTYNGDGTLCERVKIVGGPLDGMEFPFHTYVDTNGRWVLVTTQDIAYPCPNAASNLLQLDSQGPGFKIGKFGDDPAGSGELPCTNP